MDLETKAAQVVKTVKSLVESDTDLRESQISASHQFTDAAVPPVRGIFNLATGVGKTRIMAMLALAYSHNYPDSKIIVIVPSLELFSQEIEAFQEYKKFQEKQRQMLGLPTLNLPEQLDIGIFNQFDKNINSQIIFTTYHSFEKLAQTMTGNVGMLLYDEAHHIVSERRERTSKNFSEALHYGLTATPWYTPEKNAQRVLGDIIASVSIVEAIQEQKPSLAEFKNLLLIPELSVDVSNVRKNQTGDYSEKDYCEAILHSMRGNAAISGNEGNWREAHHYIAREVAQFYYSYVDEHLGALNGKKCLINCRSQEEARIQAIELNKRFGYIVARVHTSDECDSKTIQDFKYGNLLIVCQVGKLTEGFDMPNLPMTINYPTASLVHEAQGAARCLRLPQTQDSATSPLKLIVDVALKHPRYNGKNLMYGITVVNKQVTFQKVIGTPFVFHGDEDLHAKKLDKDKLDILRKQYSREQDERLKFTVISNMQELVHLSHESDKIVNENYIPPIRKGMKTSTYLARSCNTNDIQVATWLRQAKEQNLVFYLKSDPKHEHPIPLVEHVTHSGQPCDALHEAPEALEKFKELHPRLNLSLLREGMKTANYLEKYFAIARATILPWLQEAREEKETFFLDSDPQHKHPILLVEHVKVGRYMCNALHEAPEALRKLIELHPELKTPSFHEGMLTATVLESILGTSHRLIAHWMKEAREKNITFFKNSDPKHKHPLPLVIGIKQHAAKCDALYEAPEALEKFKELHPSVAIPLIRQGMKTANTINLNAKRAIVAQWLQEAREKKFTFFLDSDTEHQTPIYLVERVRNNGQECDALHEAPEALKALKKWVKETYGKDLQEREASQTLKPRLQKGSKEGEQNSSHPSNEK